MTFLELKELGLNGDTHAMALSSIIEKHSKLVDKAVEAYLINDRQVNEIRHYEAYCGNLFIWKIERS